MALTLVTGPGLSTTGPSLASFIPDVGEWALESAQNGAAIYACTSAPQTFPSQMRLATQRVPDIFGGALADAAPVDGQVGVGRSLLLSLKETWGVFSGDALMARLPVTGNLTLRYPVDASVTASALAAFALRVLGVPFRTSSDTYATALASLMGGVTRLDVASS